MRRILASALTGTLLAFLLASLALAPLDRELAGLRDPDRFVWHARIQALRAGEFDNRRVFVLGNSQTMSGVWPAALGLPEDAAYNLALPAMQPEGMLGLIRYLPEASVDAPALGAGRVAIVNIDPYSLFRSHVVRAFESYYRLELLRYDLPGALARDPGAAGDSAGDLARQLLLFSPLFELHFSLHPLAAFGEAGLSELPFADVRAAPALLPPNRYEAYLAAPPSPLALIESRRAQSERIRVLLERDAGFWTWKSYELHAASPEEACVSEAFPAAAGAGDADAGPGDGGEYDPAPPGVAVQFKPRPQAARMWRRVLEELLARGYRVALIQIPFSPQWDRVSQAPVVYAALDRQVAEILQGLPADRVRSLPRPPREALVSPADFHDATHLSRCGAARYTRWLRARLGGFLEAGPWPP